MSSTQILDPGSCPICLGKTVIKLTTYYNQDEESDDFKTWENCEKCGWEIQKNYYFNGARTDFEQLFDQESKMEEYFLLATKVLSIEDKSVLASIISKLRADEIFLLCVCLDDCIKNEMSRAKIQVKATSEEIATKLTVIREIAKAKVIA